MIPYYLQKQFSQFKTLRYIYHILIILNNFNNMQSKAHIVFMIKTDLSGINFHEYIIHFSMNNSHQSIVCIG